MPAASESPRVEAVIFDIDGVLVQSGNFGHQLREQGIHPSVLDTFWQGPFAECSLGLGDLKDALRPFLEKWGYPGSVDQYLQEWFAADATLNRPLLEEIERLRRRGVPCHVASTQERHRAEYLQGAMGLARRFDRFFFSCHLGVKKPDPAFYRHVTRELRLPPGALLFFDDQRANVEAARAAGWRAELYTLGDPLQPALARHGLAPR